MNELLELFSYNFFTNAFWGGILTSVLCGIVGTYIVSKKMVFIGGGLSHAAFGGIGIGYYFGMNPLATGIVFAIMSALGIEHATRRLRLRSDSVIAITWSAGMALGLLLVSLTPGYTPDLMTYLLGNILTIAPEELWVMLLLTIITVAIFIFMYRTILITSFDEEFAKIRGISIAVINGILMVITAATIVLAIRTVGIILILAMLSIPQETMNIYTKNFKQIIIGSIILSIIATTAGLFASYYFNMITGPIIIILLIVFYIVARLLKLIKWN